MASNIKVKPSSKDSPTEPFKRAVTGCLRALARKPELDVAFAAERPGLMGGKVRLPEPPRKLGKAEAAIVVEFNADLANDVIRGELVRDGLYELILQS